MPTRSFLWMHRLAAVTLAGLLSGCCEIFPSYCEETPPTTPPTTLAPAPSTTLAPAPVTTTPVPTTTTTTVAACVTPTVDPERSIVVHDDLAALATPFAFRKTLQAIIDTSGGAPTTPEALLKTMLDTFAKTSFPQPVTLKTVPVDQRGTEAALSPASMLDPANADGMFPVGLFNRLDLAPADGSNCGEYRIVYAKRSTSITNRLFIIFESKLPNPTPALGLAGCQPVAKFWADLSSNANAADRIGKLEQFYYQGLPGFSAVVTHANYGVPLGQVRENVFLAFPWTLREHRTWFDMPGGRPVFAPDTVKENPLVELYRAASTLPPGFTAADQADFRTHFTGQPTCNLVRPERNGNAGQLEKIVNEIGLDVDRRWYEFQSIGGPASPPNTDDPTDGTDPATDTAVTTSLGSLAVGTVSSTQLLNRAGAMSCGGCHQFSVGKQLDADPSNVWPASAPPVGFVHINESGAISPALQQFFVPARKRHLERFVCDPTATPKTGCPGDPAPTAVAARAEAAAAEPATHGLEPELTTALRRGRALSALARVDDLRFRFLAAVKRPRPAAAPVADGVTPQEIATAAAELEKAVVDAREEERRKPGAFVAVRRTH